MRALVTGCAGFIGAHLTARLLDDGWDVLGVDALRPYYDPSEKREALASLRRDRFRFTPADLGVCDVGSLMAGVDVVFHLAAQPGVRGSFGETFGDYVHDNVLATHRIFDAAVEQQVERVVYASSSSVYGDAVEYPCREGSTPLRPVSPYGVTKATCEQLANVYARHGLTTVGLRYFTVYGPRQRPDMAMRRLCEAAVGGPPFRLFGDGRQSRDFTHVVDAVDATIRAGVVGDPPSVVNVGGGEEATLCDVIDSVAELSGGSLRIERADVQQGDVRRTGADTTVARERLGWQPTVDLQTGLASEFDWVVARAWGQAGIASSADFASSADLARVAS